MKTKVEKSERSQERQADHRVITQQPMRSRVSVQAPLRQPVADHPRIAEHAKLQELVDNSPRQLAQADYLSGLLGPAAQRRASGEKLQKAHAPVQQLGMEGDRDRLQQKRAGCEAPGGVRWEGGRQGYPAGQPDMLPNPPVAQRVIKRSTGKVVLKKEVIRFLVQNDIDSRTAERLAKKYQKGKDITLSGLLAEARVDARDETRSPQNESMSEEETPNLGPNEEELNLRANEEEQIVSNEELEPEPQQAPEEPQLLSSTSATSEDAESLDEAGPEQYLDAGALSAYRSFEKLHLEYREYEEGFKNLKPKYTDHTERLQMLRSLRTAIQKYLSAVGNSNDPTTQSMEKTLTEVRGLFVAASPNAQRAVQAKKELLQIKNNDKTGRITDDLIQTTMSLS